ncbi:MAG: tetratricopeptide repeat protein [Synechococcales cyanobacterium RU_4_20]|nr:tetratricopeptide repeat protein [Synechococcales cyanobacterium RU_4_20]NJR69433.1 tetratricopeptide repeat protein [Synechococcales cyanobacterium CRU_2_2]
MLDLNHVGLSRHRPRRSWTHRRSSLRYRPILVAGAIALLLPLALISPARSDTSSLLRQAQTAQREERYPEAADLWRQLAFQWPDSAETSYNLGVALHHQFKIDEAADAYLTATVLNPSHREAYINLSLARIQLQQYDQALAAIDQVLTLSDRPSKPASIHTMAHYNRAIVLGRQGKVEASLAEVQAALAITPDFVQAQELIEIIQ